VAPLLGTLEETYGADLDPGSYVTQKCGEFKSLTTTYLYACLTDLNTGPTLGDVSFVANILPGRRGNTVAIANRMDGVFVAAVACASLVTPTLAVNSEAGVFQDGFEIGDVSSWSAFVGGPPITPPAPLRFTSLEVRDPHFVANFPLVGCFDFTDTPVPFVGLSVNSALATSIVTDNDSDGYLDLSLMLLFRPFDPDAVGEIVDARSGACVPPASATSCHVGSSGTEVRGNYDGLPNGPCLTVDPGDTSGYSPGITEPTAPCFTTASGPSPSGCPDRRHHRGDSSRGPHQWFDCRLSPRRRCRRD